ncbi:MAG: molybdenum cofactor guanylyltransferase [Archaeoglobaceae archaeon]|nr:molybdenum cofactor guanylyltransferase [Archaeoglobaceae archaeon]MDW8128665.1 molybdenum cofactor guanylyltransferase [Archaeoglobaceae archaeon]
MKLAVLMGGKGRRMGIEKAEIKICGERLIEIAVRKYSDYNPIFVCRDRFQAEKYSEEFGIKCVCDLYQNFGALAGIHSALKHNGDTAVVAIDMPFVKKELLEFIYDLGKKSDCDALIPKREYAEPLLGYYSASAIPEIERSIIEGEKRILSPLSRLRTIFYPVEELRKFDKSLISFFNINTIEDLAKAEEICSQILSGEL